jgi:hypothetical protein
MAQRVPHRSRERSPVRRGLGKAPVMHRAVEGGRDVVVLDKGTSGKVDRLPPGNRLQPWEIRTACGLIVDISQASAVEADVECKGCKKVAR